MGHSRESAGILAQLGYIHIAQPWEICPVAHKGWVETFSLFFTGYLGWDGNVGKYQRTGGKEERLFAQYSGA